MPQGFLCLEDHISASRSGVLGMITTAHPVCRSCHLILVWYSYQSVVTLQAPQGPHQDGSISGFSGDLSNAPGSFPTGYTTQQSSFSDLGGAHPSQITGNCQRRVRLSWLAKLHDISHTASQKSLRSYRRQTIIRSTQGTCTTSKKSIGDCEKVSQAGHMVLALTDRNSAISNPSTPENWQPAGRRSRIQRSRHPLTSTS